MYEVLSKTHPSLNPSKAIAWSELWSCNDMELLNFHLTLWVFLRCELKSMLLNLFCVLVLPSPHAHHHCAGLMCSRYFCIWWYTSHCARVGQNGWRRGVKPVSYLGTPLPGSRFIWQLQEWSGGQKQLLLAVVAWWVRSWDHGAEGSNKIYFSISFHEPELTLSDQMHQSINPSETFYILNRDGAGGVIKKGWFKTRYNSKNNQSVCETLPATAR